MIVRIRKMTNVLKMYTLKYSRGKVSTADHDNRPFGVFATV